MTGNNANLEQQLPVFGRTKRHEEIYKTWFSLENLSSYVVTDVSHSDWLGWVRLTLFHYWGPRCWQLSPMKRGTGPESGVPGKREPVSKKLNFNYSKAYLGLNRPIVHTATLPSVNNLSEDWGFGLIIVTTLYHFD